MPSASRTSAEPHAELAARFPCFATAAPAAAATSAAAVEMLKVPAPSPPVPTTSTSGVRVGVHGHDVLRHRLGEARDLVDGLALRAEATSRPPICAGVASPLITKPITSRASARERLRPSATAAIATAIT